MGLWSSVRQLSGLVTECMVYYRQWFSILFGGAQCDNSSHIRLCLGLKGP
jgi:hypothetical protein